MKFSEIELYDIAGKIRREIARDPALQGVLDNRSGAARDHLLIAAALGAFNEKIEFNKKIEAKIETARAETLAQIAHGTRAANAGVIDFGRAKEVRS